MEKDQRGNLWHEFLVTIELVGCGNWGRRVFQPRGSTGGSGGERHHMDEICGVRECGDGGGIPGSHLHMVHLHPPFPASGAGGAAGRWRSLRLLRPRSQRRGHHQAGAQRARSSVSYVTCPLPRHDLDRG